MRTRLTVAAMIATTLASIGLYPLFDRSTWFGTGIGAVLVVGAVGLVSRRTRLAAALCPLAGLLALLLYLTSMFAAHRALLGVIPTPSSLAALGRLVVDGWHDANTYAAPVPVLPPIDLLTGGGIGLVAILVDFLAVRVRRAALAGLPLLAMYSMPAAVRQQTVSGLAFLLGAAGYLWLLVADSRDRVSGWGRPVFTRYWSAQLDERDRPDARPLSVSGRRIGLTAVAIAVIVPVMVPGIDPHGVFGIGQGGTGRSRSDSITDLDPLDPLVSVRRQLVRTSDATVLRYRTSDNASPEYLRMYSLEQFDGENWTTAPLRGGKNARVANRALAGDPGVGGIPAYAVTTRVNIDRRIRGLDVLPLPYPPTKVEIKGDWRVDWSSLTVFSPRDSAGGRSYTVTSAHPEPSYQQLESTATPPSSVMSTYLAVPDSLAGDVAALAANVTAPASTPYDKAVKLQEWFTRPGNFTYSLTTPPARDIGALRDFLFTSRTGYCEQFASAMALLARLLGIPARVGMGYTAGARQPDGSWLVRTRDAHAWPELYFTGVGWLRFEPTPSGGGGQGTAIAPDYAVPQIPGNDGRGRSGALPAPTAGASANPNRGLGHRADPRSDENAAAPLAKPAKKGTSIGWLLAALALVLCVFVPAALRRLSRVYRWARTGSDADVAHAAWEELRASAIDHRLPWRPSDSPRATAVRINEALRLADAPADALTRLARAEERARYAREPGPSETLRDDVGVVRSAFAATASRGVRWRARVVPPSATRSLRRAGTRVLDAFDWLDVAMVRRRRRA